MHNLVNEKGSLLFGPSGELLGRNGPSPVVHQYADVGNLLAGFVPLKHYDIGGVRGRISLTRQLLARHANLLEHSPLPCRLWVVFKLLLFRLFLEARILLDGLHAPAAEVGVVRASAHARGGGGGGGGGAGLADQSEQREGRGAIKASD